MRDKNVNLLPRVLEVNPCTALHLLDIFYWNMEQGIRILLHHISLGKPYTWILLTDGLSISGKQAIVLIHCNLIL